MYITKLVAMAMGYTLSYSNAYDNVQEENVDLPQVLMERETQGLILVNLQMKSSWGHWQ